MRFCLGDDGGPLPRGYLLSRRPSSTVVAHSKVRYAGFVKVWQALIILAVFIWGGKPLRRAISTSVLLLLFLGIGAG